MRKIPWAALSHHPLPVWWGRNGQKTVGQPIPIALACPCFLRSFFSFRKRKNALSTIARKPGVARLLGYMYFLLLNRKRTPGAARSLGYMYFPPLNG